MTALAKITLQLVCRFSASSRKRTKLTCLVRGHSLKYGNYFPTVRDITSPSSGSVLKSKSHEDFRELITDDDTEKQVKLILMEFFLLKQTEKLLPDELEKRDMVNLLDMKSPIGRTNYIVKYLRDRTKYKLAKLRKQENKLLETGPSKPIELLDTSHLVYALEHNCLHFRIRDSTIKTCYAQRLAQVAKFGPTLVFDCSFESHMNRKECMNAALQLQHSYGLNFTHRTPFDFHLCNLGSDRSKSLLRDCLERTIPNLNRPTNMITLSEKNYLDLFLDKRKLIYLSPDAPDVMTDLDDEAVYIIGALVDLRRRLPLTLAKAQAEGIKCLKLPLNRHLLFKPGACKSLPLFQMTQILLEMRLSGDWEKALKAVAQRAVYSRQELIDRAKEKAAAHSCRTHQRNWMREDLGSASTA